MKLERKISGLLISINMEINASDPKKTRMRFEKAMNRLVEDEMIAGWEYQEEIVFPSRGWVDIWASQLVSVFVKPYDNTQHP